MMNDNIEVFEVAGQRIALKPDEAALVVYTDRSCVDKNVFLATTAMFPETDTPLRTIPSKPIIERRAGGEKICAAIFFPIKMEQASEQFTIEIIAFYPFDTEDIHRNRHYTDSTNLFAGRVTEVDLRGIGQGSQEAKASAETLQIEVAGVTFTMKEHEAALVIYADAKRRGVEVDLRDKDYRTRLQARFVERKAGGETMCAAIFPRIDLQGETSKTLKVHIATPYDTTTKTGFTFLDWVTLFAGNVTELDLRGEER
jgi:hypothetical protein